MFGKMKLFLGLHRDEGKIVHEEHAHCCTQRLNSPGFARDQVAINQQREYSSVKLLDRPTYLRRGISISLS